METKLILKLVVTDIVADEVTCHVIELNQNRIFKKHLFELSVDFDDEYTATITEGEGFSEINIVPDRTRQSRIVIRKCIHKGNRELLDCYVPQIRINDIMWYSVLPKGSYILKESFDPVTQCKKCFGEGCSECQNRGFRKGTSVDLKYVAQLFLDEKIKKIKEANDFIDGFLNPPSSYKLSGAPAKQNFK